MVNARNVHDELRRQQARAERLSRQEKRGHGAEERTRGELRTEVEKLKSRVNRIDEQAVAK